MAVWYSSDDEPLIIPGGYYSYSPFVIIVEPGDGDVQVQFEGSDGEYFTPDDDDYTITTKTLHSKNE